jgi:hypothetical protein
MKIIGLFSFLLLNGCSLSPVKTYIKTDSFIDIEFDRSAFSMKCSLLDKKEKKSLMIFYGVDGDTVYEFYFRRVSEDGLCEKVILKEYSKFIENRSKVRIVGIMPLDKQENNLRGGLMADKFKKPKHLQNWTFVRLQTNKGCKAYFDVDCEEDNYWAGLLPQK